MPKSQPESSTTRRHKLADFISSNGEIMVKPCASCAKNKRVCKVHVRSGKCSECLRRGQRCNLQVTQSEWERLKNEKERLRKAIKEAYEEQERARFKQERAREAQTAAFAKEMRLRQQMDLLDQRAADAVAVEEANIEELERQEANEVLEFTDPPTGLALNLSPHTWSALDDLPASFWETPAFDPVVGSVSTTLG